jgi:hypothetical protein
MSLIPGSEDTYFLEVTDLRAAADGQADAGGKFRYVYDKDVGIISLKIKGDTPHGWVRCAGRLTFDDLRELSAELSKAR